MYFLPSDPTTEELLSRDGSSNSLGSSGYLMKNVRATSSADDIEGEEDVVESGRSFLNMFSFASQILKTFQGDESMSISYTTDKSENAIASPRPSASASASPPHESEAQSTAIIFSNFWKRT
jgi:hypothetical protein